MHRSATYCIETLIMCILTMTIISSEQSINRCRDMGLSASSGQEYSLGKCSSGIKDPQPGSGSVEWLPTFASNCLPYIQRLRSEQIQRNPRENVGYIESCAGVEQADAKCSELSPPYSTLVAFSMMVGWTENLEMTKEMLEVLRNVVHALHGGAIRAAALGETHGDQ